MTHGRWCAVGALLVLAGCGVGDGPDGDGAGPRADAGGPAAALPPDTFGPGTLLRYGPMPGRRPAAPLVEGDSGRISIHGGYYLLGGCHGGIGSDATAAGDTIVLTLLSLPDTSSAGPCEAAPQVMGYAVLVATLPAGEYLIRVVHDGERTESPVDSLYTVTVDPPRRR